MKTPIVDFVNDYIASGTARLHMPGHKGVGVTDTDGGGAGSTGRAGVGGLGVERFDITEIEGADDLYAPSGIIAESEANASKLFGCPTVYSTEGSTQCVKAMLYLAAFAGPGAVSRCHGKGSRVPSNEFGCRPRVLAARNVHRAFVHAAALLDLDVDWIWPEETEDHASCSTDEKAEGRPTGACESMCATGKPEARKPEEQLTSTQEQPCATCGSHLSCPITPGRLDLLLTEDDNRNGPRYSCVYVTSPDYLGGVLDIKALADVCHRHGVPLLVDCAHGAYFRFLDHETYPLCDNPITLGADMCCTSAHKTLPVLTGGAYLHLSGAYAASMRAEPTHTDCVSGTRAARLWSGQEDGGEYPSSALSSRDMSDIKRAMQLFGSSSPSYLIMESLDLANAYLDGGYREILAEFCKSVDLLKSQIEDMGWRQISMEPLKITIKTGDMCGTELSDASAKSPNPSSLVKMSGTDLAGGLRAHGIECEYADREYVVMMFTPANGDGVFERVLDALTKISREKTDIMNAQRCYNASEANTRRSETTESTDSAQPRPLPHPEKRMSIREACMAPFERVKAGEAVGRVSASFAVKCPPAVPRIMPGEVIAEGMIGDRDIEVVR